MDLLQLDSHLSTRSYIAGYSPSQEDVKTFHKVPKGFDASKFPNVARWWNHIAYFSQESHSRFQAGVEMKNAPAQGPKEEKRKQDAGKAPNEKQGKSGDKEKPKSEAKSKDKDGKGNSAAVEVKLAEPLKRPAKPAPVWFDQLADCKAPANFRAIASTAETVFTTGSYLVKFTSAVSDMLQVLNDKKELDKPAEFMKFNFGSGSKQPNDKQRFDSDYIQPEVIKKAKLSNDEAFVVANFSQQSIWWFREKVEFLESKFGGKYNAQFTEARKQQLLV
jgi:elongation factor 1-beta